MRYFIMYDMHDLSFDALRGGETVFLWREGERRPSIFDTFNLPRDLVDRLSAAGFDPTVDVFVVAGHQASLAIAVHALTAVYGKFSAAMYHAHLKKYVIKELDYDAPVRRPNDADGATDTRRTVRENSGA